ncbi:MAG: FmdE family protein [Archangium sp.]
MFLALVVALSAAPVATDAVSATRFVHGAPPHGVPGPWALSGYRIGANALKKLGLTREQAFELDVVHRSQPAIQYTCMADGLMASTGASPGKLNVRLESVGSEDELVTVVSHSKSKRVLTYRLTKTFRDRIRDVPYADFPKAAKELEKLSDAEVFTVEETAPVVTDGLRLEGALIKPATLTVESLKALGSVSVDWSDKSGAHTFTGVRLDKVLTANGFAEGHGGGSPKQKHEGLRSVLVATSADGFVSVFSVGELLEGMGPSTAFLAWEMDGKPLPREHGTFRLVVPSDKRGSRSSYQLTSLRVLDLR